MNRKTFGNFLITCALHCLLTSLVVSEVNAQIKPGEKLPEIVLPSLDESEVNLGDLKGKVILIHLWKNQ